MLKVVIKNKEKRAMEMTAVDKASWILIVIGGLNWGLIGFFNYDFIDRVFSINIARTIYAIVGLAAVYSLYRMINMMSSMAKTPAKK